MEQVELFSTILRWLRYVLEYRLSTTYPEETKLDLFSCPMNFPEVTKNEAIINPVDVIMLPDFARAGRLYQEKRKDFQSRLIKAKPGFYLNFLSNSLMTKIVEYLDSKDGVTAKIEYLYLLGLDDDLLEANGVVTYKSKSDYDDLFDLMKKTGLFLTSYNIKLSDGLRSMSIKCYEHAGVVTFWEPSFQGDVISKSNANRLFRFINRMSYKDMISYGKNADGSIYLKA